MRLVVTLLARDEEDVVGEAIDYYLGAGADHIVATDNASGDGTRAILERHRDAGRLTLLDEAGRDHDQGTWVTRMARIAARDHGADWVINADADEFYWPEQGGSLKAALDAVPERYGAIVVPVSTFRPTPEDAAPWPERLTVRETFTRKPGGGLCVHVAHRGSADVTVSHGVHVVSGPGMALAPGWRPLVALHFPMRSRAQYVGKIVRRGPVFKPWLPAEAFTEERAAAVYDAALVDAGAAAAGAREGSLLVDDRVGRTLAEGAPVPGPASGAGALGWPDLPPERAELRAVAAQAAYTREHSPEFDEVMRLQHAMRQLPHHVRRRVRRAVGRDR